MRGRGRDFDGVAGIGRLSSSGDGRGEGLRCRCSDHQLRRDGRSKCLLGGGTNHRNDPETDKYLLLFWFSEFDMVMK